MQLTLGLYKSPCEARCWGCKLTSNIILSCNCPVIISASSSAHVAAMKFLAGVLCLASAALALPAPSDGDASLVQRQTASQITDQYLYSITLPTFTARRNARDPANLIWDSDGCSSSPDNPFGFPFVPACHRHDFGYRNYKAQNRFTDAGKLNIDNNFKTELVYTFQFLDIDTLSTRTALTRDAVSITNAVTAACGAFVRHWRMSTMPLLGHLVAALKESAPRIWLRSTRRRWLSTTNLLRRPRPTASFGGWIDGWGKPISS